MRDVPVIQHLTQLFDRTIDKRLFLVGKLRGRQALELKGLFLIICEFGVYFCNTFEVMVGPWEAFGVHF